MSQTPDLKTRPRRATTPPGNGPHTDKTQIRRGRDAATTLAERQQIGLLKASGLSNREIARQTGRARQTVAAVLAGPDVESLRAKARDVLDARLPQFAEDLGTASHEGAKRGRHEPALDALLCLGVLEKPQTATPGIVVNIGIIAGPSAVTMGEGRELPDPRRLTLARDSAGRPDE